ncbi:TetR/AcrR family transcriptional regulator [Sphingobium phenoxybenzoativorans]|uniref:TetR/AcrR family transcriptional regulator n=1 Tax=Sphingobium phenoxybenzoativorans TaxID=1592790 RepID=A0A975Q1E7_9SPHN|nr:TetR/AcrR family transcriptional regulator [Sphingobium phenoxybenzoativorans]QUT05591.1 TetR/AcrR family transcriptional regulator [Sphingobium phenoxybenzoativorans]
MTDTLTVAAGQRGPAETEKRDAIIDAAKEHFSRYGYGKTTVSDLAKAIGFSKGYIYKFFESKQAIGEAICTGCLGVIIDAVGVALTESSTPTEKFRRLFKTIIEQSAELFFDDRKLYDIAAASTMENWASSRAYCERVEVILQSIILEGRESGEFERKTPIDEVCRGILLVMQPFMNPMMLQHNLDLLPEAPNEVTNLVLRSLAP